MSERVDRIRKGYLRRAPGLISTIALLLGLLTLVDALFVGQRFRVHVITQVIPVPASAAASAVVLVSGLLLLRLAAGLRKRKRRAWRASVVVTGAIIVAHLFRDERRIGEVVVGAVLLALLVTARSRFTARSDPHSRWFAIRVLVQGVVVPTSTGSRCCTSTRTSSSATRVRDRRNTSSTPSSA